MACSTPGGWTFWQLFAHVRSNSNRFSHHCPMFFPFRRHQQPYKNGSNPDHGTDVWLSPGRSLKGMRFTSAGDPIGVCVCLQVYAENHFISWTISTHFITSVILNLTMIIWWYRRTWVLPFLFLWIKMINAPGRPKHGERMTMAQVHPTVAHGYDLRSWAHRRSVICYESGGRSQWIPENRVSLRINNCFMIIN